eukprot:g43292.t1
MRMWQSSIQNDRSRMAVRFRMIGHEIMLGHEICRSDDSSKQATPPADEGDTPAAEAEVPEAAAPAAEAEVGNPPGAIAALRPKSEVMVTPLARTDLKPVKPVFRAAEPGRSHL